MEFLPFNTFFPEKAQKETRRIILNRPWNGLEKGIYTFFELYCTDVTCDCRCARIKVCDEFGVIRATLSYGWENRRFYEGWKGNDKHIDGMSGIKPCSSQQQGKDYLKFLNIFEGFIRNDPFYAKRIQMHYFQVKEKQKSTNQYRKLSYHPVLDRWISIETGKKSSGNDP